MSYKIGEASTIFRGENSSLNPSSKKNQCGETSFYGKTHFDLKDYYSEKTQSETPVSEKSPSAIHS